MPGVALPDPVVQLIGHSASWNQVSLTALGFRGAVAPLPANGAGATANAQAHEYGSTGIPCNPLLGQSC
jgi:hypothetical protein